MEKSEIFALIERVQEACSRECDVEIVPILRDVEICLVIIQFPAKHIEAYAGFSPDIDRYTIGFRKILERNTGLRMAYLWEKQKIHKFHYEKILPILKDVEHFRTVYCCDSKFVLYTQHFGFFDGCSDKYLDFVGTKDDQSYKYVGSCWDTGWLIGYLMNTRDDL